MPVAPQVTYPGVYIQEVPSDVRTITPVDTATTAFVGSALRGTPNPIRRNSTARRTANTSFPLGAGNTFALSAGRRTRRWAPRTARHAKGSPAHSVCVQRIELPFRVSSCSN